MQHISRIEFLHLLKAVIDQAIKDRENAEFYQGSALEWKAKYDALLTDAIRASEQSAANMIKLLINKEEPNAEEQRATGEPPSQNTKDQ